MMQRKLSSIILHIFFCLILISCGSGGGVAGDGDDGDNTTENEATVRVSVDSNSNQASAGTSSAPSVSSDGRFVAFESLASDLVTGDTNGLSDIFVRER